MENALLEPKEFKKARKLESKQEKKDKKAIESTKAKPDVENNSPENAEEEKCEAERGETDRRELAGTEGLEKVFKKLNLKNLILVGHSQGCLEILEYAFKYKERLKKLVFIGGSNKMPVHPDLINLAQNGDSDAVKLMMKWGYEGSKKFIGGNPVEKIIQSPRDISEILAVDLIACNNYSNGKEAAASINCPSMFIFGALDKMVNIEVGKKFSNLVKNSSTHIFEGCGHMIMIEKAFEMREKVLEFLKK